MIKGDQFELFGHTMEVLLRKETLDVNDESGAKDLVIYDLSCTCHKYPKQLTMSVTEETLSLMKMKDKRVPVASTFTPIMEERNE